MSIIESEDYKSIINLFDQNKELFGKRKNESNAITFSKINWSETFLDFTPFESIFNQMKTPKVFSEEKIPSVKNHFINEKLFYSFDVENENWGTVFIDYNENYNHYFRYDENFDDEMVLRQLKLIYFNNQKISKSIFYLFNDDTDEETFMVDLYEYNEDNTYKLITRNGFYHEKSKVMDTREFIFSYNDSKMQILSKQKLINGDISEVKIYDGSIIE
jgi:hypothetical protein